MELFLKACGTALLAVILILVLGNQSKDLSVVLLTVACCLTALSALEYIKPVLALIHRLEQIGGLDGTLIRILLKAVGIGILTEFSALICTDSGSSSLGKGIQLLGSAVILWLCVPLFTMLLDLLQRIMGEL